MKRLLIGILLAGCTGTNWIAPEDFQYIPMKTKNYTIATWQKINNPKNNHIHIYIEGDGHAFDSYGQPTDNPTPHSTLVRNLVANDNFENVVYIARPCQFIMNANCDESDWTDGRFSQKIVDAVSETVTKIAKDKNITLVGYSGGGMISGLIIKQNPKLKIDNWITIAGVLNHTKWTNYFGDEPLNKSLDMGKLPVVPQIHFVGGRDKIVPYDLTKTWANEQNIKIIPTATHSDFGNLKIFD